MRLLIAMECHHPFIVSVERVKKGKSWVHRNSSKPNVRLQGFNLKFLNFVLVSLLSC